MMNDGPVDTVPPSPPEFETDQFTLRPAEIESAFMFPSSRPAEGPAPGAASALAGTRILAGTYLLVAAVFIYFACILAFNTRPVILLEDVSKVGIISEFSSQFLKWALPIAFCGLLAFYMIRPMLFRKEIIDTRTEIARDEQPTLYTLIEQISAYLGSPMPDRVFCDCRAGVRAEINSRGGGRDAIPLLDLTIGMPSIASLNARQLAGLIASELGRFSGMGADNNIQRIDSLNTWFAGLASHRTDFDASIEEWADSDSRFVRNWGRLTKYFVYVIRATIRGLVKLGHNMNRTVMEKRTAESDLAAAELTGTMEFVSTLSQLPTLAFSESAAMFDLKHSSKGDSLVQDYPGLVAAKHSMIPESIRREVQEKGLAEPGPYGRIVSLRDRITSLMKFRRQGQLGLTMPATRLIYDWDGLSGRISIKHYHQTLGESSTIAWLLPLPEYLSKHANEIKTASWEEEKFNPHGDDRVAAFKGKFAAAMTIFSMIGILGLTANQLAEAHQDGGERYRRAIGQYIFDNEFGIREILDVKYFKKGEIVGKLPLEDDSVDGDVDPFIDGETAAGEDSSSEATSEDESGQRYLPIPAPQSGWFYDTGDGYVVKCDTRPNFENIFATMPEQSEDEKTAEQMIDDAIRVNQ